jgi:hypothetical protein
MSYTVVNLSTGQELIYSCAPREAVLAAYAQERKDFNTWGYEERYGHLLQESPLVFTCGDWSVFKQEDAS